MYEGSRAGKEQSDRQKGSKRRVCCRNVILKICGKSQQKEAERCKARGGGSDQQGSPRKYRHVPPLISSLGFS
jgi:hypothetical protein